MDDKAFKELLAKADAGVAQLCVAYAETVRESAQDLIELVDAAIADTEDRAARLNGIADMAFELRGEGGSFGFDIVSLVADSLYRLADKAAPGDLTLRVVQMHAQALNVFLAGGKRTVDEPVAKEIIDGLTAARKKALTTA